MDHWGPAPALRPLQLAPNCHKLCSKLFQTCSELSKLLQIVFQIDPNRVPNVVCALGPKRVPNCSNLIQKWSNLFQQCSTVLPTCSRLLQQCSKLIQTVLQTWPNNDPKRPHPDRGLMFPSRILAEAWRCLYLLAAACSCCVPREVGASMYTRKKDNAPSCQAREHDCEAASKHTSSG